MTKTMNEIRMELSKRTMGYLQEEFAIVTAYERDGFPMITFDNGKETITQDIIRRLEKVNGRRVPSIELRENGELIEKYYEIDCEVYTEDLDRIASIVELRKERAEQSYIPAERELNVRAMLSAIRSLPRFKTVAIKNLRILRDTKTLKYTVENTTTRNKIVLSK